MSFYLPLKGGSEKPIRVSSGPASVVTTLAGPKHQNLIGDFDV